MLSSDGIVSDDSPPLAGEVRVGSSDDHMLFQADKYVFLELLFIVTFMAFGG